MSPLLVVAGQISRVNSNASVRMAVFGSARTGERAPA